MFNSNEVERVESYKYVVFEFHATKTLAHITSQLVSAAKQALHSMNCRCAPLPISGPALRCKLFDSLVLPILWYASEVWGVEEKIRDAAELLHRQFLKQILDVHVRDSSANVIVLAKLCRFPLSFHWWQQIVRYHNCINYLSDDKRLIMCAFLAGMHHPAHLFGAIKFTLGSRVNL